MPIPMGLPSYPLAGLSSEATQTFGAESLPSVDERIARDQRGVDPALSARPHASLRGALGALQSEVPSIVGLLAGLGARGGHHDVAEATDIAAAAAQDSVDRRHAEADRQHAERLAQLREATSILMLANESGADLKSRRALSAQVMAGLGLPLNFASVDSAAKNPVILRVLSSPTPTSADLAELYAAGEENPWLRSTDAYKMAADRAAQSLPTARPPQATLPTDVDRLFSAYNAQEGRATAANASLILDVATRLTPEQQELAKVSSAVDSAKKAIVSLQTPLRSEETPPIDYAKALESLGKRAEVGYGYTPEQALAYARAVLPIKQGETITADDLDRIAGDIPKGVTSPGQKQQAAELQYQEAKADYFPEGAKARQAVAIPLIAKAAADALGGQDAKKNPRAFASAFFETFGQRWVVDAASKGFPTEYVDRLRYEAMIFVAKHPEFFKDIAPMLTPDRVAAIRDLATGSQGLDAAAGDISAAIGPDATPDDLAKAIAASVAASVAGGVGNVVPR